MIIKDSPYMSSILVSMDEDTIGLKPLSQMPMFMLDMTSNNLDNTIDIDNYKDYIDIKLKNVFKTY